jgi:CubicO group peptidase (beta-lactamase class C family)
VAARVSAPARPSVPAGPPALPDDVAERLSARVREAQRDWRAPSVVVRVVRRGDVQLDVAVGAADLGADGLAHPPVLVPGPDVQYRMGSITKTFTATLVLQARDDGLLRLDDRLGEHLDVPAHGDVTLRRMLCHLSGLQREPVGEVWESLRGPDLPTMLAQLPDAESVLNPQERWHYSNLAFALLGQVVARVRRTTWEDAVTERLLQPLGLTRTTFAPSAPVARGYSTDPYADRLLEEPLFPGHAFAPAAELWTTTRDLARWATFWADPVAEVLAPSTVAEMTHLHAMADLQQWTLGWGLGLMLHRRSERLFVGHDGAMPGFLAGMVVHRDSGLGVVVLTNTGRAADPGGLALQLADAVLDEVPDPVDPWSPGAPVPADVDGLLGTWWSEGTQYALSWRAGDDALVDGPEGGHVELAAVAAPPGKPPSVLRSEPDRGTDHWRVVSGREQGELLRAVRREDGTVERLYWATYPMTREHRAFGR